MRKAERRAAQATRVRMDPSSGLVVQRAAWGTGDPARPWHSTTFDEDGRAVVYLWTEDDVRGYVPMVPVRIYDDDDFEPEIDLTSEAP